MQPIEIEPDAWCAWCGASLPEEAERDPRQHYCSPECRKAHWHDTHKPPAIPKRVATCAECGTVFETHRSTARFCCKACHRKAYRRTYDRPSRAKPPPDPRPCIECGQEFQPRRRDKLYCSASCGNKHRNRRWRAKG